VPDHWVNLTTASIREPTLAGCVGTASDLGPERDRRQRRLRHRREAMAILLGMAAAEVIDIAWLAHEHSPDLSRMSSQQASVQVVLAPRMGGALMGVMGRL